jgi:transposase
MSRETSSKRPIELVVGLSHACHVADIASEPKWPLQGAPAHARISSGRAGRKPKLSARQLRKIEQALRRGPEALGYASGLWTAARVRELIEDQCGVRYHEAHVWRILRQLGWSCQRPTGRALERDEEAIRYWKRVRWPRLKKKRSASGAPSSSSTRAG